MDRAEKHEKRRFTMVRITEKYLKENSEVNMILGDMESISAKDIFDMAKSGYKVVLIMIDEICISCGM